MQLLNEEQILKEEIRARIIKDIESPENISRKNEAVKRHEVYKDNVAKYVMLKLKREIKLPETLALMENRAANISICRKIINKLARVYAQPAKRQTGIEATDLQVSEIAKMMNFDQKQKKVDRLTRLQKNTMPWIYPDPVGDGTYRLCMKVFSPHQFDVISNPNDPEDAMCIVLSDYFDQRGLQIPLSQGPQVSQLEGLKRITDDYGLASSPEAVHQQQMQKTYIWWTNKYHFTTDASGAIIGKGSITPDDYANPIEIIPGVTSAEDQDGDYWASGGQDLVDGSILVNTMLTDRNSIAYIQGWGQMVITGTNIKDEFIVGPHHALILRHDPKKDEAQPTVSFANASPPLAEWANMISQLTAMLLSTNNLSPATVSDSLDPNQMASGIAMLIDRSESTDSINDKQNDFYWIELRQWEIIKRWFNLFYDKKLLTKDFMAIGRLPDDMHVTPIFASDTGEIISTADQLDNMRSKKDLGIASSLDLLLEQNPGMTREDAQKRMAQIAAENQQYSAQPKPPPEIKPNGN